MNKKGYTLVELMLTCGIVVIILGVMWPLTWWTGRSLDWVLSEWKHHAIHVPYWLDFLLACIGNGFTIAFDIVIEILRRVQ